MMMLSQFTLQHNYVYTIAPFPICNTQHPHMEVYHYPNIYQAPVLDQILLWIIFSCFFLTNFARLAVAFNHSGWYS